ncbi:MAG: acyl-CoA dehydratase activase [Candidatus Hodarchaeales archaeon]|jgi:predicted CoA-substrate-specific enzyme activase
MTVQTFIGIDIGSSTSKAVVINFKGNILSYVEDKNSYIMSTGYGRRNVPFTDENITEITSTARGAFEFFPGESTIVDIGGQDNKVILLSKDGSVRHFKLNRKCSAGTGAFLEEIAWKLDLTVENMDSIARNGNSTNPLNSFCSVFASTEVLERIRQGESLENMLMSAYHSIVRRIFDMTQIKSPVIMSGGAIQYHPIIGEVLKSKFKLEVFIPPNPQILPAFGAALLAKDHYLKKKSQSENKDSINISLT